MKPNYTWEEAKQRIVESLPDIPGLTPEEYWAELTSLERAMDFAIRRVDELEQCRTCQVVNVGDLNEVLKDIPVGEFHGQVVVDYDPTQAIWYDISSVPVGRQVVLFNPETKHQLHWTYLPDQDHNIPDGYFMWTEKIPDPVLPDMAPPAETELNS